LGEAPRIESRRLPRLTSERARLTSLLDLTDENFDQEVLDTKALVVIGFWSGRRDLCQPTLDVLQRLADSHPEIKVGLVDATRAVKVAEAFDVRAVPHLAIVLRGDVVFETVGTRTFEELEKILAPFIEATD
jgi:thioredoxin 1